MDCALVDLYVEIEQWGPGKGLCNMLQLLT